MVCVTRQETKAAREYEAKFKRQTEFFQEVLALATSDINRAYELWWTETKKDQPWAVEATTDEERREGFRRSAKFCLKQNKGSELTNVPTIQGVLGEIRRRGR